MYNLTRYDLQTITTDELSYMFREAASDARRHRYPSLTHCRAALMLELIRRELIRRGPAP